MFVWQIAQGTADRLATAEMHFAIIYIIIIALWATDGKITAKYARNVEQMLRPRGREAI